MSPEVLSRGSLCPAACPPPSPTLAVPHASPSSRASAPSSVKMLFPPRGFPRPWDSHMVDSLLVPRTLWFLRLWMPLSPGGEDSIVGKSLNQSDPRRGQKPQQQQERRKIKTKDREADKGGMQPLPDAGDRDRRKPRPSRGRYTPGFGRTVTHRSTQPGAGGKVITRAQLKAHPGPEGAPPWPPVVATPWSAPQGHRQGGRAFTDNVMAPNVPDSRIRM